MREIIRKFGVLMMLAASLTVAGHVFEHCTAGSAAALLNCPVCQSITASSAHAASAAEADLVFLRDAVPQINFEYYFFPASTAQSRAPPHAVIS